MRLSLNHNSSVLDPINIYGAPIIRQEVHAHLRQM